MLIDNELIFSKDVQIIGDTDSASKDLVKAGGMYDNAWFYAKVGSEVFNTLTSINIALQTSDDDFAADTVVLFTKNFLLADIDAINTELMKIRVPLGVKQYIRVSYDVVGTDNTTGKMYAAIVPDVNEAHD